MYMEHAAESERTIDEASKVFEIGPVSEETQGLPHVFQESPTIQPGPMA
jgi:hypothetical protein